MKEFSFEIVIKGSLKAENKSDAYYYLKDRVRIGFPYDIDQLHTFSIDLKEK